MGQRSERAQRFAVRAGGLLAALALLGGLQSAAAVATFNTPWQQGLPWADASTESPAAAFGGDRLVAFAGLDGDEWQLVGASAAGRVMWTTELPLRSSLPSAVVSAAAGQLAVMELDSRVYGVHPGNGSIEWNVTSPCGLGDPRLIASRYAADAVYLVCNERSGDSTIVALAPGDGATLWTLSTMMAAGAAVPLRDATAATGIFIYGDTGSNITALSAAEGRLLWRVDVAALVNTTRLSASVTSLELADGGDVLLVREYAAGLTALDGPFSYLALALNASGGDPQLLWSAESPEQRERLVPGVPDSSPIMRPALAPEDDLFFYWSADVQRLPPPPPPPAPASPPALAPAPAPALGPLLTAGTAGDAQAVPAQTRSGLKLLAEGAAAAAAVGPQGAVAPGPLGVFAAAPAPAPGVAPEAAPANVSLPAEPLPPAAVVPSKTEGSGVIAPEGFVTIPVLKARQISTGEELWSVPLTPVSGPTAAGGSVAVVTPEGLLVLDGRTGALAWAVDQRPIGIYSYAPALVSADAALVRNCLNYLGSNSICLYTRRLVPARRPQAPPEAPLDNPLAGPGAQGGVAAAGAGTSGAAGAPRAALPALAALLCAAALVLF